MSTTGIDDPAAPDWLTAPLQPISLRELNAHAAMLERRDNKYVVRGSVLRSAVQELAAHFRILEIDGRRAFTYETRYFDDADRTSYFDHHRGRRRRCKVRMRRYVDTNTCFLEIKLKDRRSMTVKKRLACPPEAFGRLDERAIAFVRSTYGAHYGLPFDRVLRPVLDMHYQRVTLVALRGGERMTIDRGLVFGRAAASRAVDEGVYIIETKSANANGIADAVLRRFHQHPTRHCSKYCVGMAALQEVDKYNNFMHALRRLDVLPPVQALPAWADAALPD